MSYMYQRIVCFFAKNTKGISLFQNISPKHVVLVHKKHPLPGKGSEKVISNRDIGKQIFEMSFQS